jgi:hypothetical protein
LVRDSAGHQNPDTVWTLTGQPTWLVRHRGKTVTKPLALSALGLALSEKQIPQVVENLESGGKSIEALERVAMRPTQASDQYHSALQHPQCINWISEQRAGDSAIVGWEVRP